MEAQTRRETKRSEWLWRLVWLLHVVFLLTLGGAMRDAIEPTTTAAAPQAERDYRARGPGVARAAEAFSEVATPARVAQSVLR
jgi:hypothetical protein